MRVAKLDKRHISRLVLVFQGNGTKDFGRSGNEVRSETQWWGIKKRKRGVCSGSWRKGERKKERKDEIYNRYWEKGKDN